MESGKNVLETNNLSILVSSKFLDTIIAACLSIYYGMFHTKIMERDKFICLSRENSDLNGLMELSPESKKDILSWINICDLPEVTSPIRVPNFNCVIFSDASKSGWGGSCSGLRARGWWNEEEAMQSINDLELIAAYYALLSFTKSQKGLSILFRIDNTTAISYVNRFGGVQFPKLNYIARKIWMYCEEHGHYVCAAYINTKDNFVADAESRSLEYNSEWTIDDSCFHRIIRHFNYHPSIDLFASHSNHKLNLYVSW